MRELLGVLGEVSTSFTYQLGGRKGIQPVLF